AAAPRGPEVELVVPEVAEARAGGAERAAHLGPLKKGRPARGRKKSAADGEARVRVLPLDLFHERGEASHPASPAAVDRPEHVVVIDLQEGQSDEVAVERGWAAARSAAGRDDGDDDKQRGERRARPHEAAGRVLQKRAGGDA